MKTLILEAFLLTHPVYIHIPDTYQTRSRHTRQVGAMGGGGGGGGGGRVSMTTQYDFKY